MKICALCDTEITRNNDTKEHVIPNAIGGRKKIKGFICKNCNSKSGAEWDADLANKLNPLSLIFRIQREKGEVPAQSFKTTGGEEYILNTDGSMSLTKPVCSEQKYENGAEIGIQARSEKELKKMRKGVIRKYSQIYPGHHIENAKHSSKYSTKRFLMNYSFDEQKAGRSMIKSALSLAVENGIPPADCEHARDYLLNDNSEACYGYYYEQDLVVNRPWEVPFHCVAVQGTPDSGLLVAYVEYFGFLRMIACLSSNYTGNEFNSVYAIDPVNGTELDLSINLNISKEKIKSAYRGEKAPECSLKCALGNVIRIHQKLELHRVFNKAFDNALSKCGVKKDQTLSTEQMSKLGDLFMTEIYPLLPHLIG